MNLPNTIDEKVDLIILVEQLRDVVKHVIDTADDSDYERDEDFVSALDWSWIRETYKKAKEAK